MSPNSSHLRHLGKNGPLVPALGYGMISVSAGYGTPPPEEERSKLLDHACKLGYTFWDTADIYGDNEAVIGRWLQRTGKRDQIFLATKFGMVMDKYTVSGMNSSPEYCMKACEASLKKLGVECIDLYYAHRLNADTPVEETIRAMVELQKEGKIKHIGLSEVSSRTLIRAANIATIACVQMEYSPFELTIEREAGTHLLRTCRELGVSVVCYSPLGRGLLTGTLTTKDAVSGAGDLRGKVFPRFSEENLPQNVKIVQQFEALAGKKGCTASQLALAWLLKQGEDVFAIPGTKKVKYMEENWAALEVDLTDEDEAEVRKFVEGSEMNGYRSVHTGKGFAYVDTKEEE